MTPTRARGRRIGSRQLAVLRRMARSGDRWPTGWVLQGTEKVVMASLVERGWVQSLESPVLTESGRKLAHWV